jgi:FkbM family methyltransferase
MTPRNQQMSAIQSSPPAGSGVMASWRRWKRFWRRIETADPVWRAKRLVRQALGTELRYFPQLRAPKQRCGGWCFSPEGLSPGAVVYSLGVGEDVGFDLALIERFGATVHAFDPTPGAVEWVKSRQLPAAFHFHQLGIADFDGVAEFSAPVAEGNVCFTLLERAGGRGPSIEAEVRRLPTILAELGHDHIDLLKMDIEGAEYTVIPDLVRSGIPVRQILVEFHHRFRNVGNERTREAVELLLASGFRILHISASGREYSFVHVPEQTPAAA